MLGPDVDVVVVGGGPAGSATAIWCARRGLRVALCERARFPRHRPGETLPPGAEPIFGQLGVAAAVRAAGFVRHPGTWVTWAGPRRFEPFGGGDDDPWLGFQAPREDLDRILLAAAVRAGAVVHQPCRVLRPRLDGGRVAGVETATGPIAARWVVDAAGGGHWLAHHLGLPLRCASPRLIARYGYARGECPTRGGAETEVPEIAAAEDLSAPSPMPHAPSPHAEAPEIVADETGWTWSARIAPGRYHWTRLSLAAGEPPRAGPPPRLAGLTPLGRPRGADVTWRMVARPAGAGYVCAGDAAAVLDPASSHGVLKALMSGMMAGHVIAHAAAGAASPQAAIQTYTAWLTEWFEADVAALTRLYGELPCSPAWAAGAAPGPPAP